MLIKEKGIERSSINETYLVSGAKVGSSEGDELTKSLSSGPPSPILSSRDAALKTLPNDSMLNESVAS